MNKHTLFTQNNQNIDISMEEHLIIASDKSNQMDRRSRMDIAFPGPLIACRIRLHLFGWMRRFRRVFGVSQEAIDSKTTSLTSASSRQISRANSVNSSSAFILPDNELDTHLRAGKSVI